MARFLRRRLRWLRMWRCTDTSARPPPVSKLLWQGLQRCCSIKRGGPSARCTSWALDELDPFRDGRAAERMGTYLTWLLEGFKGGLRRETVMADAAERYRAIWGQ